MTVNASVLMDEYRVEQTLHSDGWDLHPYRSHDLDRTLHRSGLALRERITLQHPGESITRAYTVLREQLSSLVQQVGYQAGEAKVFPDRSPSVVHARNGAWQRFMGRRTLDADSASLPEEGA